jgi:lysozyme
MKATEGGDFVDARFAENWRGASAAGLERGAYHFFTLCTPGETQARNFLSTVPPGEPMLAPGVDLELIGSCNLRPSPDALRNELQRFIDVVEAETGARVVLYESAEFEERYHLRRWLDRERWTLRFMRRPGSTWTMWQVTGLAHVDGIDGRVDLDVMRPPPGA